MLARSMPMGTGEGERSARGSVPHTGSVVLPGRGGRLVHLPQPRARRSGSRLWVVDRHRVHHRSPGAGARVGRRAARARRHRDDRAAPGQRRRRRAVVRGRDDQPARSAGDRRGRRAPARRDRTADAGRRRRAEGGQAALVVDNSTDGLVLVDDEGRVAVGQPGGRRDPRLRTGEAAVGTHVLDFVHPDDIEAALPPCCASSRAARSASPSGAGPPRRRRLAVGRGADQAFEGDSPDEHAATVFSLRDVTDRVRPSGPARRASCASVRWSTTATTSWPSSTRPPSVKWVTPNSLRLARMDARRGRGHERARPGAPRRPRARSPLELAEFVAGEGVAAAPPWSDAPQGRHWRPHRDRRHRLPRPPGHRGHRPQPARRRRADRGRGRPPTPDRYVRAHQRHGGDQLDGRAGSSTRTGRPRSSSASRTTDDERSHLGRWLTHTGQPANGSRPRCRDVLQRESAAGAASSSWSGPTGASCRCWPRCSPTAMPTGRSSTSPASPATSASGRRSSSACSTRPPTTRSPACPTGRCCSTASTVALARSVRRHASSVAALFCDLDHFKVVNDSLGHGQGDRVIVEVARRLPGPAAARATR